MDDLVADANEYLEDFGLRSIDDDPYGVLANISDQPLTFDDLNDFANRCYR